MDAETNQQEPKFRYFEKTVEWLYVKNYLSGFGMPLDGYYEIASDAVVGKNGKFLIVEFKKNNKEFHRESQKYFCAKFTLNKIKKHFKDSDKSKKLPNSTIFISSSKVFKELFDQEVSHRENQKKDEAPIIKHPHIFIYGKPIETEDDPKNRLTLEAIPYWSKWAENFRLFSEKRGVFPNNINEHPNEKIIPDAVIDTNKFSELPFHYGCTLDQLAQYLEQIIAAKGGTEEASKSGLFYLSVLGIFTSDDETKKALSVSSLWEFSSQYLNEHSIFKKIYDVYLEQNDHAMYDLDLSLSDVAERIKENRKREEVIDQNSIDKGNEI